MSKFRPFQKGRVLQGALAGSAVLASTILLACGGDNGNDPNNTGPDLRTIEVFDSVTGIWTPLDGEMSMPWSVQASGVIGGELYVVGGSKLRQSITSRMYSYDPATDVFTVESPMNTPREGPVAGVIGGKLYVATGGRFGGVYPLALEIYDPATGSWTSGQNIPTGRFGAMAGVIDDKLYVVGGNDLTNTYAVLEIYDPVANSWSTGQPMPTARSQGSAAVVDGELYVIGGYLETDAVTAVVEVYDPVANTWTTAASMPTARGETVAAAIDGVIYVAGGNTSSNPSVDQVTGVLQIYTPVRDEWTTGNSMVTSRGEAAEGVISGKMYVAGGYHK